MAFLWVHPSSDGVIDLDDLLGEDLKQEFDSWNFESLMFANQDTYETDMNWKLAIDTFGRLIIFLSCIKILFSNLFMVIVKCLTVSKEMADLFYAKEPSMI